MEYFVSGWIMPLYSTENFCGPPSAGIAAADGQAFFVAASGAQASTRVPPQLAQIKPNGASPQSISLMCLAER